MRHVKDLCSQFEEPPSDHDVEAVIEGSYACGERTGQVSTVHLLSSIVDHFEHGCVPYPRRHLNLNKLKALALTASPAADFAYCEVNTSGQHWWVPRDPDSGPHECVSEKVRQALEKCRHEQVAWVQPRVRSPYPNVLTRATESAKLIIERAWQAGTGGLHRPFTVTSKHLLLGLLAVPQSAAVRALGALTSDLHSISVRVRHFPPGLAVPDRHELAGEIVANAIALARLEGCAGLRSEHLLLAILGTPECHACQVLMRSLGVEALRSRLLENRGDRPPE